MAAINPNNRDFDKPTGSLEELFRHHLAEAEAPVRPLLWDQIDNTLLVQQNATFRRRLTATRWVAAASVALAMLASGGWWAQHQALETGREVASRAADRGNARTAAGQRRAAAAAAALANAAASKAASATNAAARPGAAANSHAAQQRLEGIAAVDANARKLLRNTSFGRRQMASAASGSGVALTDAGAQATRLAGGAARPASASSAGLGSTADGAGAVAAAGGVTGGTAGAQAQPLGLGRANGRTSLPEAGASAPMAAAAFAGSSGPGGSSANGFDPNGSSLAGAGLAGGSAAGFATALLDSRPVALAADALPTVPANLTALSLPADAVPVAIPPARKWQFGATYAATAYNPNIDFSRVNASGYDYNPALGADSPALTEAAAAEYREHLTPGLGQRLTLRATRRLGGRWAVSTGAEITQSTATSSTTRAFVGEQLFDLGMAPAAADARRTSYRYRTAGLPLELRYANPVKRGWTSYVRVGAVVSALFGVRAEVEGLPEATKTYSLRSGSGGYRRVMADVRGGAGLQYRPAAGSWAFSLGPVAEAGLMSLNAHPGDDFLHQSRPYSLGVEAGVEFGK